MKLAIFDLDGVLADDRHRLPFALKRQWPDYFRYDRMIADGVWQEGERELFHMQSLGWEIAYMTGRQERTREATEYWLDAHDFPAGVLHMRKPADNFLRLGNYKVKRMQEIMADDGLGPGDIVLFDDDPAVVAMVRRDIGFGSARHCTWHVKEKAMIRTSLA